MQDCNGAMERLGLMLREMLKEDMLESMHDKVQIVLVSDDGETHDHVLKAFDKQQTNIKMLPDCHALIRESYKSADQWDVLLIDEYLGAIPSVEFINKIRINHPHIKIIVLKNSIKKHMTSLDFASTDNLKYLDYPLGAEVIKACISESGSKFKKLRTSTPLGQNHNINDCNEDHGGDAEDYRPTGQCPKFTSALEIAKRVAPSCANIFLFGESGTGKEIFAKYIHGHSSRKKGPFVAINCSAIPDNLFESEFFGHTKGSFTGALNNRAGFFEAAQDGTLFLDEIADLSLSHQAKILRVLQDKKVKPVGSNEEVTINCRIISATHKNLAKEVVAGNFREDLFFRLNVIPIFLPALRDRKGDISILANIFLKKFVSMNNSRVKGFSTEAMDYINKHQWRGNVRELENAVERAVILCSKDFIQVDDIKNDDSKEFDFCSENDFQGRASGNHTFSISHSDELPKLETVINEYISYAVEQNHGAKDKTAKEIGIDRKTLYKRL